jgi:hypothetical protein
MPVPLTTAALALAAIMAAIGADLPAIIIGSAGALNQVLATWATSSSPKPRAIMGEDPDGGL